MIAGSEDEDTGAGEVVHDAHPGPMHNANIA